MEPRSAQQTRLECGRLTALCGLACVDCFGQELFRNEALAISGDAGRCSAELGPDLWDAPQSSRNRPNLSEIRPNHEIRRSRAYIAPKSTKVETKLICSCLIGLSRAAGVTKCGVRRMRTWRRRRLGEARTSTTKVRVAPLRARHEIEACRRSLLGQAWWGGLNSWGASATRRLLSFCALDLAGVVLRERLGGRQASRPE